MYEVRRGTTDDIESIYEVLQGVIVDYTKPPDGVENHKAQLRNSIRASLRKNLVIVLICNGSMVGAMLLRVVRGVHLVIHSNVLDGYKRTVGSAMLNDLLMNSVFANEDIYLESYGADYHNLTEQVNGTSLYKIRDDVRFRVREILRRRA